MRPQPAAGKFMIKGQGDDMHLFETKDGDRWVCITCAEEKKETIQENGWEWILDREDQVLRCVLCGHPDYDFEY
jgi:hypothetical protein